MASSMELNASSNTYKLLNTTTTSYHMLYGLTSKILILAQTTATNTHTYIQHTTQTDNGCLLLKLKELSLLKITRFIEYSSLFDRLLLVQYMSLKAPPTQKYMLTYKQQVNHPTTFWEHMHYVAFSRVTSISGLYIANINEDNISTSKKVSDYLNNSPPHNNLQTHIQFHGEQTCNILLNNARSF